jgi:hypothetical protein
MIGVAFTNLLTWTCRRHTTDVALCPYRAGRQIVSSRPTAAHSLDTLRRELSDSAPAAWHSPHRWVARA